ncbi:hypothetical protein B0A48_00656 [Cryoendolithus antarcticus]|uniref:Inositol polyphosphate-related phosphatase domain-containing protein n=1 Tax=Cryoendolithus antarcticus TaxID=1507870 RepID=A0A1V8TVC5_9PEZI|nr:hypothetical protein B0A48_00656 [Cryoendolithus antarcticus]
MPGTNEGPDGTSIRPVSSLLTKFENLGKDGDAPRTPTSGLRQVSLAKPTNGASGTRPTTPGSSDSPPAAAMPAKEIAMPRARRPSPPRQRPISMFPTTPAQVAPPVVTVDSPRSPPGGTMANTHANVLTPVQSGVPPDSPTRGHFRSVSRTTTPALEKRISSLLQSIDVSRLDLNDATPAQTPTATHMEAKPSGPPPVNRAAKPRVPSKPVELTMSSNGLAAPESNHDLVDHSASPFSTPPASRSNSPEKVTVSRGVPIESAMAWAQRTRGDSDASWVERLQGGSDTSSIQGGRHGSNDSGIQRMRGESDASFTARARAGSNASFVEPSSLERPSPPISTVAGRRDFNNPLARTPTMPARYRPVRRDDMSAAGDLDDSKPRLPARPELQIRSGRTSPTKLRSGRTSPIKSRSGRTSPSKLVHQLAHSIPHRSQTFTEPAHAGRIPAAKPAQASALTQGFDRVAPSRNTVPAVMPPAVPAPRRSMDRRPQMAALTQTPQPAEPAPLNGHSRDDQPDEPAILPGATQASDFPDTTNASRRPPRYRQRPWQIPTDYDTRLMAVCGHYVCTTGYITKAWDLRTGEQIMNMAHSEHLKVTSIVFKPTAEAESTSVWLGTNIGEIHEVDILGQAATRTKANAHRREIIRMYRNASELWTLDEGGDLNVWKKDDKTMPSLDSQANTFRVPKGHTFSIACGEQLWIATGKDIRVFLPGVRSETEFQVLRQPLSQSNSGEVTAGATISSKPDLVYFGHTDGKVSIYNRKTFSCVGVVNVSVYKISALAGVGDYLWAGFNTGMAYVYDTSTTPWVAKKDWHAHEKQICSIVADPSAVWLLDRMQVITLGTDNMLRLWDGSLEDDWLDTRMHDSDSDYCTFHEITVDVLTWNAGASKPTHLQQNHQDNNFFREYLTASEPADILVFGFQELVDLEDKKVTAKSFFKSKKKVAEDSNEQQHMSHQYRNWRDHLTRCLDEHITNITYALVHTASMVGLFTCIFVKTSLRPRIKAISTAEIKRGMGGLHGNKGALVVRMTLDDSSLCFINCHLAAGQTQTINRNNDVAAILEAEALAPHVFPANSDLSLSDLFTSGGDGSMILDHELCILNGDLNYRIDTMGRDTVIKHVSQKNLARLLERDQLLLSRKKNPGFRLRAFAEAPITFAPTYKYNVQSDEYDTSEKRRAPAWCDRVLYRGLGKVKCESYRRWEVRVSDHRPVSARLRCRVKSVDPARRKKVWERSLGEFEEVRKKVRGIVEVDYLMNVLGLTRQEAIAALRG